MYETILVIHVVISTALIAMVLIQHGKGSGMGALGGGASNTLFGSQGSANFMSRTTAMLATGFFVTSLTLSYLAIKQVKAAKHESIPTAPAQQQISDVPLGNVGAPSAPEVPAAPVEPAAPATAAEHSAPAEQTAPAPATPAAEPAVPPAQ